MKEKLQKIDKKIWIMGGSFLILIIVIILGGALVYNKFFLKHTYSEVETIMLNATKNYLDKNSEKLPININDSITIPASVLIDAEEMKTIESYLKEDENTCDGEVIVTKISGNYRYTPFIDCGYDKYQTIKFTDYIENKVDIVESGNGLYNLNDELVYRGDKVDNYITFSGKLYRIVKFTNESPVIIYTEKMDSTAVWDNRYNVEKQDSIGINDYSISRIRDTLNELYKGNQLVSENDKLLVIAHDVGIGRRNSNDTDKTGALENAIKLENQYIGLLQINDYLNASTDVNCTTTISPSCINYNYLSKFKYNWWTTTASSLNTYRVFSITGSSVAKVSYANSSFYLRPVFYLTKDLIYVSGNGSKESPYIVK